MTERVQRAARQFLRTDRLLGVDFVPRPTRAAPAAASSAMTAGSVEVKPQPAAAPEQSSKMSVQEKQDALDELRRRHDDLCPHCTTATAHTQTVFGEGHPNANLMFIGEAPGQNEDETGRPFVGRAGEKLNDIITAMGLSREQVYIANVLKSRPPNNRTPLQHEVDACGVYLAEQIRIIEPAVLVTLGGPATKLILNTNTGITKLRGMWATYTDERTGSTVPVMPTFHPAYLLRSYTPENRRMVWSDMQQVMERLGM